MTSKDAWTSVACTDLPSCANLSLIRLHSFFHAYIPYIIYFVWLGPIGKELFGSGLNITYDGHSAISTTILRPQTMIDELLVHISAPTTRQTDELYRSLADDYLEFEAQRTHRDESREDIVPSPSAEYSLNAPTPSNQEDPATPSFLSTSKDSYGSFPSYLSSDDHTKIFAGARNPFYHGAGGEDNAPTSSRLDQLDRIHESWKKQTTPKAGFTGGEPPAKHVSSSPDEANTAFIENTQEAVKQLQSQLPDCYSSTSVDTSEEDSEEEDTQETPVSRAEPPKRNVRNAPRVLVPETPKYGSVVSNSRESLRLKEADSVAESPIPVSLSLSFKSDSIILTARESLHQNDASNLLTSTPQLKQSDNTSVDASRELAEPIDFSKLCIDAYPPEPKVSIVCPGSLPSQITKALEALKEQNPTRFRPIKRRGTPKADDRGYWFVDCAHWPLPLQQEFWMNMCEQIASKRLGWGATLHREGGTSQSLGRVRLYCWGEVVEHMWLVLWLCSRAKVIGSKLKWIDANGIAIFEMV